MQRGSDPRGRVARRNRELSEGEDSARLRAQRMGRCRVTAANEAGMAGDWMAQLPNASVASCWAGDLRGPSTISWPQAARMSRPRLLRTETIR